MESPSLTDSPEPPDSPAPTGMVLTTELLPIAVYYGDRPVAQRLLARFVSIPNAELFIETCLHLDPHGTFLLEDGRTLQ